MLEQRIQQQFFDSADLKVQAADALSRPIGVAVQAVVGCITGGGKLLAFGAGASMADAQRLAAQLVGRFERERPALAALVLGADPLLASLWPGEGGIAQCAQQQLQALGMPGDVLLVLGAESADPVELLPLVRAAHHKDMAVVALTGRSGGVLADELAETDVLIAVPHERAVRIREVHALALHCLCDAVDLQLMGEQDTTHS